MYSQLITYLIMCHIGTVASDNLLPANSFDHPQMKWSAAGENTTATADSAMSHSSGQALYVIDRGKQMGQTNSAVIPVTDTQSYYMSAWVRVDPNLADKVVVDLQSFRLDRSVRGGAIVAGRVSKGQLGWVRVAKVFQPRVGAKLISIRVMPAASKGAAHGACWIDDIVFKRAEDVTADDMALEYSRPAQLQDKPMRVQFRDTTSPIAGRFDFEDMTGWSLRYQQGMDRVNLLRSQWQLCQGDFVARLTYQTTNAGQTVEMVPPQPIVIDKPFDTITLWIGQFYDNFTMANVMWAQGPTPRINLIDGQGNRHRINMTCVVWQNWSVARAKLDKPLPGPVKIEAIALDNLPACEMIGGPRSYPGTSPRDYAFDALRFTNAGTTKVDLPLPTVAIPTRPETLLPSIRVKKFTAQVKKQGERYTFEYRSADERVTYSYEPITGSLDDIRVSVDDGKTFKPMAGGGPVLKDGIERKLISCGLANDVVTAKWRVGAGDTVLTYQLQLQQKSLRLSVTSNDSSIEKFMWGGIGDATGKSIYVPFLIWTGWQQHHTVHLVDNKVFVSRVPDFYVSDFSGISFDGKQGFNQYNRLTDGTRHKLNEHWIITASSTFDDVLPNIPHPPNAAAKAFASFVFARDHLQSYKTRRGRAGCYQYLRLCKRFGVDRLMIKITHLTTDQSDWGILPAMNVYDDAPRSMEGGLKALQQHIRYIQSLGFKTLLYTDYHQLDPIGKYWNPDHAAQTSDGNWADSWRHCYKMSPLAAPAMARNMTRSVKDKLGIDGTYLDESGSVPFVPDYDARKPGAGLSRVAHKAQMEMVSSESPIHGGPSYGEGGMQWLWAGMLSGTYGQSYWPGWKDKNVWLVDFEVRKVHPLMTNLSMGYAKSRYAGLPEDDKQWAADRFNAAPIAFGHARCFKVPFNLKDGGRIDGPRWIWREKRDLFREYFTFQALNENYAMKPVAAIYYEKGGKEYNTSDALRQGAMNDNHVHITYAHGLDVYVNGSIHKDDVWEIKRGDKTYRLPQNGYLFEQPGKLLGYGALVDGHRVDFVNGPRYLWADARGEQADFGLVATKGCVIIRKDTPTPGSIDIVLVSGDAASIDAKMLPAGDVVPLDVDEKQIKGSKYVKEGSRLRFEPSPTVISYRLTPP